MILLYLSLLLALIAGLGRQIAVFGKIEKGLWLFSNWKWLRAGLTSASTLLALVGLAGTPGKKKWRFLPAIAFLNGFSYFFEMPFFFPEVIALKRVPGAAANINGRTEVIGVQVGETAVAYPINEIVMPRHIVHDTIGETAVLISYCALCRSALAFKAEIDGNKLAFKVAGVWRRNMIMIDEQTHSIWQQATGECIFGPYTGRQLELLSGENTIWQSWQKSHPDSEFAHEFVEARRGLMSREQMLTGLKWVTPRAGTPGFTNLHGLPKRETVFGLTVNGQSKAYPISRLQPGMTCNDTVGSVEIALTYDGDAQYLSAVNEESGEPIIVEKHWWLGWKEFHPETEIWENSA